MREQLAVPAAVHFWIGSADRCRVCGAPSIGPAARVVEVTHFDRDHRTGMRSRSERGRPRAYGLSYYACVPCAHAREGSSAPAVLQRQADEVVVDLGYATNFTTGEKR